MITFSTINPFCFQFPGNVVDYCGDMGCAIVFANFPTAMGNRKARSCLPRRCGTPGQNILMQSTILKEERGLEIAQST